MDWGGPNFVFALVTLATVGWLINNWIRARHGYALEDEWGGKTDRADSQETVRLMQENAELRAEMGAMKDRLVTVERIVTDSGFQLTQDIDRLREPMAREPMARETQQ
ncbi:MAG: hypothetical protein WA954_11045 [Parerythrobacter sp.]